jgi:putative endonuclease
MAKEHRYFVYILASARNGTLYVGVTNDLAIRSEQHRDETLEGFTKKYGVHMLVWFEEHGDIQDAIAHEKRIKKWRRAWKLELIEKTNPDWRDLALDLADESFAPADAGALDPRFRGDDKGA